LVSSNVEIPQPISVLHVQEGTCSTHIQLFLIADIKHAIYIYLYRTLCPNNGVGQQSSTCLTKTLACSC